jgi:hypothetical protein
VGAGVAADGGGTLVDGGAVVVLDCGAGTVCVVVTVGVVAVVCAGAVVVLVTVVVVVEDFVLLWRLVEKSVVPLPPLTGLPAISSGTVNRTTQIAKPIRPVMIAKRHRSRRERVE